MRSKIMKVMVAMALLAAGVFIVDAYAETYDIQVTSLGDAMWNDFYYYGGDHSWDVTNPSNYTQYYYDGPPAYRNHWYSYLQVALPALGSGEDVISATFNFNLTSYSNFNGDPGWGAANLYIASNSASADGNATQQIGGDQHLLKISDQQLGWVSVNVTSQIINDINAGYSYAALSFNPAGSSYGGSNMSFMSGDSANAPFLSVVTTPEPASMALFGLGGLGLAALRRRKK